jgi:hypothetical protein
MGTNVMGIHSPAAGVPPLPAPAVTVIQPPAAVTALPAALPAAAAAAVVPAVADTPAAAAGMRQPAFAAAPHEARQHRLRLTVGPAVRRRNVKNSLLIGQAWCPFVSFH